MKLIIKPPPCANYVRFEHPDDSKQHLTLDVAALNDEQVKDYIEVVKASILTNIKKRKLSI